MILRDGEVSVFFCLVWFLIFDVEWRRLQVYRLKTGKEKKSPTCVLQAATLWSSLASSELRPKTVLVGWWCSVLFFPTYKHAHTQRHLPHIPMVYGLWWLFPCDYQTRTAAAGAPVRGDVPCGDQWKLPLLLGGCEPPKGPSVGSWLCLSAHIPTHRKTKFFKE